MKLIYSLIFLFFLCLQTNGQKEITIKGREFSFTLVIDSVKNGEENYWDSSAKSITIIRLKDNKKIQTIIPDENSFYRRTLSYNFVIEDMNFDGFEDFKLLDVRKGMNSSYWYWLYDPIKKQFIENKELEGITSAIFDRKKKMITSDWKGGAGYYGHDEYIYRNGNYVLVKKLEEEIHKEYILALIKKRVNGKLITLLNKRFTEAEYYKKYPEGILVR